MRCLYCGESLSLLRKLKGQGEFCSEAHRDAYQSEFNSLALGRLRQSRGGPVAPELERSPRPAFEAAPEEDFEFEEALEPSRAAVAVAVASGPPEAPYLVMATDWASAETGLASIVFPPMEPERNSFELPEGQLRPGLGILGEAEEFEILRALQDRAPDADPLEAKVNILREAMSFPADDIHLWMAPLSLGHEGQLGQAELAAIEFSTDSRSIETALVPIPVKPVRMGSSEIAGAAQHLELDTECQGPALVTDLDTELPWQPRPVCDPVAFDLETSMSWTTTIEARPDFEDRRFEFVFRPTALPEWVEELKTAAAVEEKEEKPAAARPRRIIAARPRTAAIEAPGAGSAGAPASGGGGATIPPGFVAVPLGTPLGAPMGAPMGSLGHGAQGAPSGSGAGFAGAGPAMGAGFVMPGAAGGIPAGGIPFVSTFSAEAMPGPEAAPPGGGASYPAGEPQPHVFHMPPAGGGGDGSDAPSANATAGAAPVMLVPAMGPAAGGGQPMAAYVATPVMGAPSGGPQARQGFTMGGGGGGGGSVGSGRGVGVTVSTTVLVEGADGSVLVQNGTKVGGTGKKSENGAKSESAAPETIKEKLKVVAPASFVAPTREPLSERTLRLNPKPLLQAAMPVETPRLDPTPLRRAVVFGPATAKPADQPARQAEALRAAAAKSLPADTEKPNKAERGMFREASEEPAPASSRNLKLALILLVVTALIAFAFWKFTAKSAANQGVRPAHVTATAASISDSLMQKGTSL